MFGRSDFDQLEPSQVTDNRFVDYYPGLYYLTYPQHSFKCDASEEFIRITRAPKLGGDNGLRFWLASEWTLDWRQREKYFHPYLKASQFEFISEPEFNQLVSAQTVELITQPSLPLHPPTGFICALLMYSMKTDFIVSLFAEYDDEFIHFYWHTTA